MLIPFLYRKPPGAQYETCAFARFALYVHCTTVGHGRGSTTNPKPMLRALVNL
jgi:hypothetical protein